ncbi:MAG: DUF2236 domain-containing protein, partial [Myxococcales bacterium]|nr:DUF2236 domain-containing protein [Myxococcales bacterium]
MTTPVSPPTPARVHNAARARARFGGLLDRVLPFYDRCDPLADAVVRELDALRVAGVGDIERIVDETLRGRDHVRAPASLRRLALESRAEPVWLDRARLERAGGLLFRAGPLGGFVLMLRSLVAGYMAPAGNKPLALSGRLLDAAPRRLSETSRFVAAVCKPRGLRPGAEGHVITLKVRLMHARVRALVRRSGRYREREWGAPINQHDMMATILLFSQVFIDGLRILGLRVDPREADDYVHLWRYVGWLIGVEPELLPACERESQRLLEFVRVTQGTPDDDSRALTDALLQVPMTQARDDAQRRLAARLIRFNKSLCRVLIGDELADAVALPRYPARHAMPALQLLLASADSVRARVPGLPRLA